MSTTGGRQPLERRAWLGQRRPWRELCAQRGREARHNRCKRNGNGERAAMVPVEQSIELVRPLGVTRDVPRLRCVEVAVERVDGVDDRGARAAPIEAV